MLPTPGAFRNPWTTIRAVALVAAFAFGFTTSPAAYAQAPATKVLVVQMAADGVPAPAAASVQDRVRSRLSEYENITLLDTPQTSLLDEMFELECFDLDDECLGKLSKKYRADKLLLVSLGAGAGGGVDLELKAFDPATGQVASSFKRLDLAQERLAGTSGKAILSLFGPPPPPKPKTGTIEITSSVAGAAVRVGAVAAGETPFTAEVEPGTYPVTITKVGYQDYVSRITVVAGKSIKLRAKLEPIPIPVPVAETKPEPKPKAEEDDEGTPIYETWWFWTGVGAVVAGSVTAAVLLANPDDGPARGNLDLSLRPWDAGSDPAVTGR